MKRLEPCIPEIPGVFINMTPWTCGSENQDLKSSLLLKRATVASDTWPEEKLKWLQWLILLNEIFQIREFGVTVGKIIISKAQVSSWPSSRPSLFNQPEERLIKTRSIITVSDIPYKILWISSVTRVGNKHNYHEVKWMKYVGIVILELSQGL
jgi:hypothetical protein